MISSFSFLTSTNIEPLNFPLSWITNSNSEVSKKLNAPFMMTSAKDGRNVGEAFQNISESMVEGM